MVSFQCDGCTDVVKKPKLDQHRLRCKASFTCIDCSKTFPTPADWKGHTSCISEAEKYQKSLYKPKQNRDGREKNYRPVSAYKYHGHGGFGDNRMPRSQATGANGTPLGTPPRMSPVTTQPTIEIATTAPVENGTKFPNDQFSGKKRKADEVDDAEKKEKTDKHKDKKRKSGIHDNEETTASAPFDAAHKSGQEKERKDKHKDKGKKDKKDKNKEKSKGTKRKDLGQEASVETEEGKEEDKNEEEEKEDKKRKDKKVKKDKQDRKGKGEEAEKKEKKRNSLSLQGADNVKEKKEKKPAKFDDAVKPNDTRPVSATEGRIVDASQENAKKKERKEKKGLESKEEVASGTLSKESKKRRYAEAEKVETQGEKESTSTS